MVSNRCKLINLNGYLVNPIDVEIIDKLVTLSQNGDRDALESLVISVQKDVYNLAIRFLWHPQDAEDASQEILIRVITGLANFQGKSSFRTWVYRIACNTLLTQGKKRMEHAALSLEEFGATLADGLSEAPFINEHDVAEELLLEEVKIGCTHAMLLCLDRDHRFAYILGEILDLDHVEGAEVLEITPAAFRKRLSRANQRITTFMMANCGLVEPDNPCQCKHRIGCAIERGYVLPKELVFAPSLSHAKQFPKTLLTIRQLNETRRVAALYQSHPQFEPANSFLIWLRVLLNKLPEMES